MQLRHASFMAALRSTVGSRSRSRSVAISCCGRSQKVYMQSRTQGEYLSGTAWGQVSCIVASQPRVSQHAGIVYRGMYRTCFRTEDEPQVRVVTSDNLIRLSALRSGVLRTSSKEFSVEVEGVLDQIDEVLKKSNTFAHMTRLQDGKA